MAPEEVVAWNKKLDIEMNGHKYYGAATCKGRIPCRPCVQAIADDLRTHFGRGAHINDGNCYLRFETYPFEIQHL